MSVDEVADLRQRNRALADEVEGLRAALAARAETDAAVAPADETAFGRAFWRAPARIDATLPDPDPARLDDAEFRNLADHLPILCWLARSDGYLFWYNRRWLDYCGTTQEAMAGWGWQAVHDPAELPRVKAVWAAAIATGEPFEMVFPLRGADGVFRPFLTRIVPLRTPPDGWRAGSGSIPRSARRPGPRRLCAPPRAACAGPRRPAASASSPSTSPATPSTGRRTSFAFTGCPSRTGSPSTSSPASSARTMPA